MGSPHTLHEWREKTADGETHYHRAWRGLGKWHFQTTLKSDPDWTVLDSPDEAFLRQLRAKLADKYQRRRVPWEHLDEIDRLIAKRFASADSPEPGSDP